MKIDVNSITIPEKSTSVDPVKIQEMQDSIKEMGLSHPIIVRRQNNSYILVSGEKRLIAVRNLGIKEIEADVREMTDIGGKILRLHENLRRFNLDWPEQVNLIEELHKLRQAEHGTAEAGRPKKKEEKVGWSLRDTAKELKVGVGPLSEDILLARALRIDPKLAEVKDKKTAVKLARITMGRQQDEDDSLAPSRTQVHDYHNTTYLGDAAEVLRRFDDESVDHVITDPPWIKFFDPKLRIDERTVPVFKELYRVMKTDSILYLFSGFDDYVYYSGHVRPKEDNPNEIERVYGQLEHLGFHVSLTPIIWKKVNSLSRRGVKSWEYDRDFEIIVVAAKGNPILARSTRISGVKSFPVVPSPSLVHPNEKPVDLIADLISDCSYEHNVILDPFAGSGVVGLACKKLKRKYILIERDPKFHANIVKRLKEKR